MANVTLNELVGVKQSLNVSIVFRRQTIFAQIAQKSLTALDMKNCLFSNFSRFFVSFPEGNQALLTVIIMSRFLNVFVPLQPLAQKTSKIN